MNNKRSKQLRKLANAMKKEDGVVMDSKTTYKKDIQGNLIPRTTVFHKVGTGRSVYQRLKRAFKQGKFSSQST